MAPFFPVNLKFIICVVQIKNERGDLHKSPFYNGHTTYGGRAAYRESGCGDPYKVLFFAHFSCFLLYFL